ncbi:MAG: AMP-dependent synthetase, partial [Verrucomicrobiales bacterium]|nr:AMP-dependent synthetase [Verrucomicrobiales bacterium]
LILSEGVAPAASQAATQLGIQIIRLETLGTFAGSFNLISPTGSIPPVMEWSQSADVALVLHTSGTTARPKIVPLTQHNLVKSAQSIAQSLHLSATDRCLNVMPLFHVHGLIGALLSSLSTGASIICSPGFYAPDFFDWLSQFKPTWFTAVPTMHQSIVQRYAEAPVCGHSQLRFIRSCSAALAPKLMHEIETRFDVPVIEAYGMTEASHQMAINPLPPGQRKPGSVGLPAGLEVAVMHRANNTLLAKGQTGEVVIRGESVTSGYESNPEANKETFTDGWFRTGDEGYLDSEGYLFLTGRIKEIINRGGEKISPREIDEVLLEHPAVAQAVAFAMPDSKLGEEVAAVVVLRKNAIATPEEIRSFAAGRLAHFKVPANVVIAAEIPKGPTGKIQRRALSKVLGLEGRPLVAGGRAEYEAPVTPAEQLVSAIWEEVLRIQKVGRNEDFMLAGGDSMAATRLASRLRDRLGLEIPMTGLLDLSTVAAQALFVMKSLEAAGIPDVAEALLLASIEKMSPEEAAALLENMGRESSSAK